MYGIISRKPHKPYSRIFYVLSAAYITGNKEYIDPHDFWATLLIQQVLIAA